MHKIFWKEVLEPHITAIVKLIGRFKWWVTDDLKTHFSITYDIRRKEPVATYYLGVHTISPLVGIL